MLRTLQTYYLRTNGNFIAISTYMKPCFSDWGIIDNARQLFRYCFDTVFENSSDKVIKEKPNYTFPARVT